MCIRDRALTIYPDEILQEETIFMEDGTRRIVDLLVSFTKADPAIYVEKWEGQLAIEIKDTHPVDSKKISQMKQKGLACLEFTVSKWNVRENFNNAEDEEKQTIEITEKLDGKNGGYIWGELLVDPISRKYFSTKLYEDEKREKERAIAELNQVKKLYGQVIDTNKPVSYTHLGIGFITFVVMFILYVLAISISMSISASFWKQLKDNVE